MVAPSKFVVGTAAALLLSGSAFRSSSFGDEGRNATSAPANEPATQPTTRSLSDERTMAALDEMNDSKNGRSSIVKSMHYLLAKMTRNGHLNLSDHKLAEGLRKEIEKNLKTKFIINNDQPVDIRFELRSMQFFDSAAPKPDSNDLQTICGVLIVTAKDGSGTGYIGFRLRYANNDSAKNSRNEDDLLVVKIVRGGKFTIDVK